MKTIKATPNNHARTFTLRVYHGDKLTAKYRTLQMDKETFESSLHDTENDWKQFLKSGEYYNVK